MSFPEIKESQPLLFNTFTAKILEGAAVRDTLEHSIILAALILFFDIAQHASGIPFIEKALVPIFLVSSLQMVMD